MVHWAHLDTAVLKTEMTDLIEQKPLAPMHRNHKLTGNWKDHWECHLAPDWLLIYQLAGEDVIFERTGGHADLF